MQNKFIKGLHFLSSKIDKSKLYRDKDNLDHDEATFLDIIHFISENYWEDEELLAINEVENLRSKYLQNNNTVEVEDFGAGKRTDTKTAEEMRQGHFKTEKISTICKRSTSDQKWGELLFRIIRAYQPQHCIELGTCLGIATAYGIQALKINQSGGHFSTFEGAKNIAEIAQQNLETIDFQRLKIEIGRFDKTLPEYLQNNNKIDFAFIDGHHDYKATLAYHQLILEHATDNAILIYDDINWSPGMQQAWKEIKSDSNVKTTFDFYFWGICLIDKGKPKNRNYKIWF